MLIKDLSSTILCLCLLANVGPDAFVSGRRRVRVWDERRSRLGYETDESGTAFADKLGYRIYDLCFLGAGRRISLLLFEAACRGKKTEILNVGLFFVVSLSLHPARPEKKYHYFRTLVFYMKYLTRFAVAMLMASPAMLRAQSVSDSTSTRESVHDWLFAAGHANVLATYLSPLEYTGPAFSVAHRSERLARWGRGKVTVQGWFQAQGSYTASPTKDNHFYDGRFTAAVAWHRNWHPAPGLRLGVGGQAEAGGGITYSLNGGNNPAEGRVALHVGPSVTADYAFRVGRRKWSVNSQMDVPLLGLAFTPTYGQSYYEMFSLGHSDHNVRVTHPFNAPSLRWTTLCRIPVLGAKVSVGYQADIVQSHLGGLKYHAWNHTLMIGYTRRLRLVRD